MPPKISYEALELMMADPSVPDRDIARYLTALRQPSASVMPHVVPDPEKVDMQPIDTFRTMGAGGMRWANNISRWRRQRRFDRRVSNGETLPVIASEGDSWSQFPFLLDDVFDQIEPHYLTWCVAAAGDTLSNMIHVNPEYEAAIQDAGLDIKAFVFSGAGNDYMGADSSGVAVLSKVLRPYQPGRPASWHLETTEFEALLNFVRSSYVTLLTTLETTFPTLPVVLHGYDYAIPYQGSGTDARDPIWAKPDEWLAGPMASNGIVDPALQGAIVREMVDRLNTVQRTMCGGNVPGASFRNAHHVDLRGTLPDITDWADELHPTNEGFRKVATLIRAVLDPLVAL